MSVFDITRLELRKALVLIAWVLLSCGQSNQPSPPPSNDSGEIVVPFPHPEGFQEAIQHGIYALDVGPVSAAESRCAPCHDLQSEEEDGIPGCKSCHAQYPHPKGFGESSVHVAAVFSGDGDLTTTLEQNCGTTCHGGNLAGGLSGVSCNQCHSLFPHKLIWSGAGGHSVAFFQSVENENPVCQDCHGSQLQGGTYAPTCTGCHTIPTGTKPFQHKPFEVQNCTSCHTSDEGESPSVPSVCQTCHSIASPVPTYRHSVVLTGNACANCHDPHESENDKLLSIGGDVLCYQCHDREIQSDQYGTTENILEKRETAVSTHPFFQEGDCKTCHAVHGGNYDHLLLSESSTFCLTCHDEATYVTTGWFYSDPNEPYTTEQIPSNFVWGNVTSGAWRSMHQYHVDYLDVPCVRCHDAHASTSLNLILPEENYSLPSNDLGYRSWHCSGCHITGF